MILRPATENDAPLIADAVISSVASQTETVIYEKIFGLNSDELKKILTQIAEEEIEGQELTYPNHLILIDDEGNAVGCCASWVEQYNVPPSNIQKAQIWSYYLGQERWKNASQALETFSGFSFEREAGALQLEAVYIAPPYRNHGYGTLLIENVIQHMKGSHPFLQKAQIILFKQNEPALRAYLKAGFQITAEIKAERKDVLQYVPYDEKLLLERFIF